MALFNSSISLLIFCLEDLSIVDSRMLKSSSIKVLLSISFLKSSKNFVIYLGASMLGAYVYKVYVFLVDSSLEYYDLSLQVFLYDLCFEVYVVLCIYCYPSFFFPVNSLGIFFPVCVVCFVLRWVSCWQHM